jgi:hypothetical protein
MASAAEVSQSRQVDEVSDRRESNGKTYAAQGLKRFEHGGEPQ